MMQSQVNEQTNEDLHLDFDDVILIMWIFIVLIRQQD